jgi:hypothetical protein
MTNTIVLNTSEMRTIHCKSCSSGIFFLKEVDGLLVYLDLFSSSS